MNNDQPKFLQPDDDIRPEMDVNDAPDMVKELYGLEGGSITEFNSYDDKNYYYHSPKINKNPHIDKIWSHGYVLKVTNSLESQVELTEAQNDLMLFLRDNGIRSTIPVKNSSGQYYSVEKLPWKKSSQSQQEHIVRLLEFQPGEMFKSVKHTGYDIFYKIGIFLGRTDKVLKNFHHPGVDRDSVWGLTSAPDLISFLNVITDAKDTKMIQEVISEFQENILPRLDSFDQGIIHGDFNEQNILVVHNEDQVSWDVAVILDMGDVHRSYYIFELAVCMCYMMIEAKKNSLDPIIAGGYVLAGFKKLFPLRNISHSMLKTCICVRLCQSLVLGLHTNKLHPENVYVLSTQEFGWQVLTDLWLTSTEKITEIWEKLLKDF